MRDCVPATYDAAKTTRATNERVPRTVQGIFGTARDRGTGSCNRLQIAGSLPEKRVPFSYLCPAPAGQNLGRVPEERRGPGSRDRIYRRQALLVKDWYRRLRLLAFKQHGLFFLVLLIFRVRLARCVRSPRRSHLRCRGHAWMTAG